MNDKEREFRQRLLATYRMEAEEHLETLSSCLLALEKPGEEHERQDTLEQLFRAAHSLKGASRSVGLRETERLCHRLESTFASWKKGRAPNLALFDVLHAAVDMLRGGLAREDFDFDRPTGPLMKRLDDAEQGLPASQPEPGPQARPSLKGQILPEVSSPPAAPEEAEPVPGRQEAPLAPSPSPGPPLSRPGPVARGEVQGAARPHPEPVSRTVRVTVERLASLMLHAEEFVGIKLSAGEIASNLSLLEEKVRGWRQKHLPTVEDEELDDIWVRLSQLASGANSAHQKLGLMVDAILHEAKQVLLMPFSSISEAFPRMCRDLARAGQKEVEVQIRGEDTEVDRRILEEVRDPLIHLLRNCVDHGIEPAEERVRKGKAPQGKLIVSAAHKDTNTITLTISDDGRGLNLELLKAAAVRAGRLTEDEAAALQDGQKIISLAFQSGISTSPILTDVSGRGLGLAIVQEKIEQLGGDLQVESQPDQGTLFRLQLPITIATFRGVLVRVGEARVIVPTLAVERVLRINADDIATVEGREVICAGGVNVPLAKLREILQVKRNPLDAGGLQFGLLIRVSGQQIAFLVDEVLSEQEVMAKGLGKQLLRVKHIAGTAVLGSGALVPIVHVRDIVATAVSGKERGSMIDEAPAQARASRRVLLAEDSITARALIKSILESAGFTVRTAVDGAEAWTLARAEKFDIIVSDVEMPRMNGFDLTAKIRADNKLKHLPIILVTALETREDKERGIDAGADAYILKSSFDQGNLLATLSHFS